MSSDLQAGQAGQAEKEKIIKSMTNLDFYPFEIQDNAQLAGYTSLPISQLLSFGDAFAPVVASFMNVSEAEGGTNKLLKTVFPKNSISGKRMEASGISCSTWTAQNPQVPSSPN